MAREAHRVTVVDSHTAGEPTRVVISGVPDLGKGPLKERAAKLVDEFDQYRSAIVNEPRGSNVLVGALLTEPFEPDCVAGVIFFINVGLLGMCGHGTIGLVATLAHLGRITAGTHRIDTPVGVVSATLEDTGFVSIQNVAAYRHMANVEIDVPGFGSFQGDVAYGGNWFFLVKEHPETLELANVDRLLAVTLAIREALEANRITGANGALIDHVELFSSTPHADSRNFVLCPGRSYDRSPCGTGTSAKLACLYADGKLQPGEIWRQESIVGGIFEGSVEIVNGQIIPTIRGRAFINAEATLLLDPEDPYAWGIR